MDPIQPWIDASETRQLAERLMHHSIKPAAKTPDTGFSDSFEGFAAAPQISATAQPTPAPRPHAVDDTQPLAEITTTAKVEPPPAATPVAEPEPAPAAVTQPDPEPVIQAEPAPVPAPSPQPSRSAVESSDPSLHSSLKELQQQLNQNHQADNLFILNRAGETLFGKDTHTRLQFIARNLLQLASRKGAPSGNVHIKVGPARVLEIISTESSDDSLILGTIVPEPLSPENRKKISHQLDGMHIARARS